MSVCLSVSICTIAIVFSKFGQFCTILQPNNIAVMSCGRYSELDDNLFLTLTTEYRVLPDSSLSPPEAEFITYNFWFLDIILIVFRLEISV
jgi:hypothetical protein